MKKRQESREQAFIMIFEKQFNPDYSVAEIAEAARDAEVFDADGFACSLAEKTYEAVGDIDAVISSHLAQGWRKERLSKVVLSILRLSVCEIMFFDNIPTAVSINEAVELAKKYAPDGGSSFVNALLGSVSRAGENKQTDNGGDLSDAVANADSEQTEPETPVMSD